MIRKVSVVLILLLAMTAITRGKGQTSEAIDFLKTQAAIIKGETSSPQVIDESLPFRCGTPVFLAAYSMARKSNIQALNVLQTRPDLISRFGSDHFVIHYDSVGAYAPYQVDVDVNPADGAPDFINRVSEIFEHVWQTEIDSLGYNPPPTDNGRGGDDRYDVYLVNLGFGYFGFTDPEEQVEGYHAVSFIVLENDFQESPTYRNDPVSAVKVTAAHEFFHAIQFGYDAFEFDYDDIDNPNTYKPWWMEASSTWMEDVVYDDVNDYLGYLHFFYKYIWVNMTSFSYGSDVRAFHPYASCVWPIYMTEKYNDIGLVREIWEGCGAIAGYNTLTATDAVLRSRGSNLGDAFLEFSVWNFHTGLLADTTQFFSEGNTFPAAETTFYISNLQNRGPVEIPTTIEYPEQFATNFIMVETNSETPGGVQIDVSGILNIDGQNWRDALLGYEDYNSRWQKMPIEPTTGDGSDSWAGWNFITYLVLIPTVTGFSRDPNSYSYNATFNYDSGLIGGDTANFSLGDPRPSPYLLSGGNVNIPYSLDKRYDRDKVVLRIYSVSGELVREIAAVYTGPGSHSSGLEWNGKNGKDLTDLAGENVSSGVYIMLLSAGNKSATQKIAVVNDIR